MNGRPDCQTGVLLMTSLLGIWSPHPLCVHRATHLHHGSFTDVTPCCLFFESDSISLAPLANKIGFHKRFCRFCQHNVQWHAYDLPFVQYGCLWANKNSLYSMNTCLITLPVLTLQNMPHEMLQMYVNTAIMTLFKQQFRLNVIYMIQTCPIREIACSSHVRKSWVQLNFGSNDQQIIQSGDVYYSSWAKHEWEECNETASFW